MKVLVVKLRALGDAIITTALIQECHRHYPQAEIHYLVPQQWADLFKDQSTIRKLWLFEKWNWKLIWQLRAEKFDLVLVPHASKKTAWIAKLSGAKTRIVHNHNFHKPDWFSHKKIPNKNHLAPFVQRDLKCLEALGLEVNKMAKTKIELNSGALVWAENFLKDKAGSFLALCLGASRPSKVWPMEYFARIASQWAQNGSVFVIVGPTEKRILRDFLAHLPDQQNIYLLDNLKLTELAALLSKMKKVLGNDSGPRHLAAAVGTKTVTLYGPQDPFECHPYDQKEHPYLFIDGLKCRDNVDPSGKHFWCGVHTCLLHGHQCMKDIGPKKAWDLLSKN